VLSTARVARSPRRSRRRPCAQRGLSLVELMVGIAVGLVIVAGASLLVASQLGENRRLLLETQVQQDLRATADIVARELRRAGTITNFQSLIWSSAAAASAPQENPFAVVDLADATVPGTVVRYRYERTATPATDTFRYLLTDQTIRSKIGDAPAQDLTDRNTLRITGFTVRRIPVPPIQMACPELCPDGTQACWPTLELEDLEVTISGHAAHDTAVARTRLVTVRVRNDRVDFNTASGEVCP
jgi:prepilin-type N-terminal cleavage/methylation domain-containing protein